MPRIALRKPAKLEAEATPAPWFLGRFDDEYFMSAISIEVAMPDETGQIRSEVIAATLIQQPAYVVPSDNRYYENARLIAEMRNALPELLRLAEIGRQAERLGLAY